MSETNGKTTAIPEQRKEWKPYRPEASTEKIYAEIESGMKRVVSEATLQASHFLYLFDEDKDQEDSAVRFVHLVDATECLELALDHLGQLKRLVDHRMTVKAEQNTTGQNTIPFDVF